MKLLVQFSTILFLVFSMVSCDKDDNTIANSTFKATLNGTSEVPSNASSATGTATLTYNPNTKVFTIGVTHNLAAATAGHIHKAAAGSNGDVVFPFTSITSPINFTSVPLSASQESDLNAGLMYVNLHTASFPGGEIRGQLIKQ
jgi:Cu/Zn superoxide dismutase